MHSAIVRQLGEWLRFESSVCHLATRILRVGVRVPGSLVPGLWTGQPLVGG